MFGALVGLPIMLFEKELTCYFVKISNLQFFVWEGSLLEENSNDMD